MKKTTMSPKLQEARMLIKSQECVAAANEIYRLILNGGLKNISADGLKSLNRNLDQAKHMIGLSGFQAEVTRAGREREGTIK